MVKRTSHRHHTRHSPPRRWVLRRRLWRRDRLVRPCTSCRLQFRWLFLAWVWLLSAVSPRRRTTPMKKEVSHQDTPWDATLPETITGESVPPRWVDGGGLPESQGLLQDDHDALQCVKMTKGRGICQKCLFRYSGKRILMSCNESEITASIIYQCISYSKSLSSQHAFFYKKTCWNEPLQEIARFWFSLFRPIQWAKLYPRMLCWDEFCLWQRPYRAQRHPWPFQVPGFRE